VTDIVLIEACLDGSIIKQYHLSKQIDKTLMHRLSDQAKLDYYDDFPRPYFRIARDGYYLIQGVIGLNSFRVTFSPQITINVEKILLDLVSKQTEAQSEN
jgi:hypothetical protein